MTRITVESGGFGTNSHSKSLTSGVSWCISRAHEADPSQKPMNVVCRCRYVWYGGGGGGLYLREARMRARARAYTPPPAWLSNRVVKKGEKKNPRTLTYASYGPQVVRKPEDLTGWWGGAWSPMSIWFFYCNHTIRRIRRRFQGIRARHEAFREVK